MSRPPTTTPGFSSTATSEGRDPVSTTPNTHSTFVIAIDGPSGTGKSTVARHVAIRLAAGYLDSGAIYRILTLAVLRAGADPEDPVAVSNVLSALDFSIPTDPDGQVHRLGAEDVSAEIRSPRVTAAVSAASRHPEVRARLLGPQRDAARSGRMVVEGRDIGTVVVPDAELKIYLTADAAVRARRRFKQDAVPGGPAATGHDDLAGAVSAVQQDLLRRDTLDSTREHSPLQAADDAVVIDSTEIGVDETVERVLSIAADRGIVGSVP